MVDEQSLSVVYEVLNQHSGYLRNTVRQRGLTCDVCACPVLAPYTICYPCNGHRRTRGIADRVGSMIYAVMGQQSYHLMSGYKSSNPGPTHPALVTVLAHLAVQHLGCASRLGGQHVTQWATVPSLKPDKIGSQHPLRKILASALVQVPEVAVAANPPIAQPRALRPANFVITSPVTVGAHVLVVDDNWVSGGHAQSVAASLKQAGAQQVSVLNLSRVLDLGDKVHGPFIREHLDRQHYDPRLCPWTGSICP
ncbi:hypothetical protein AB0N05_37450 [Nocardia sp. NPDC051030]|uniref:hypothetical protein n=1 Tax=Nocardia sp. NPDC051030 TaxID=3155162 RepID=UPI0034372FC4